MTGDWTFDLSIEVEGEPQSREAVVIHVFAVNRVEENSLLSIAGDALLFYILS